MSFVMTTLKNNRIKIEHVKHPEDNTIEFKCVGGKINAKTLHSLIKNGYNDKPKDVDNIDGYVLDKSLSGTRAQVYHNPKTNHLVVNHRGTKGLHDVMTDIGLMFGHKNNKRFQHGKKVTDQALRKYDTNNVSVVGHSLGSQVAKESNKGHGKEIISVNGAVTPYDLLTKQKNNETHIRSNMDVVSAFHTLNPFSSKSRTIDIKAKSYSPLVEHSSDILDRLGDVDVGV